MARAGLRLWSGRRGRSSARSKNDVLPQLVVGLQVPVGVAEFVGEPPRAQLSKPVHITGDEAIRTFFDLIELGRSRAEKLVGTRKMEREKNKEAKQKNGDSSFRRR